MRIETDLDSAYFEGVYTVMHANYKLAVEISKSLSTDVFTKFLAWLKHTGNDDLLLKLLSEFSNHPLLEAARGLNAFGEYVVAADLRKQAAKAIYEQSSHPDFS